MVKFIDKDISPIKIHSFSCARACSAASAAMAYICPNIFILILFFLKIRFIEEKICYIRGQIPTRDRDWRTTIRCGKGKVLSRSCNNRGRTTEARTYIQTHRVRIHYTPSVKVIRHHDFASASTAAAAAAATGCAARKKLIPLKAQRNKAQAAAAAAAALCMYMVVQCTCYTATTSSSTTTAACK
uniref:FLYWCH-type domain-containing protein n=1 Tax=Trichogramma kaykai TaxID=54128 RepID=A0ABD2WR89_9HYME